VGSNQTQKQSISFRVILYIRNPKDHVSSRIQNIIRWGSDFQSAYQKVSDHLDHYYREKIEALQDTFGKNNIEVFQFEEAKKNKYGVAGHFLNLLDFTEKELSEFKYFRVNNRISKKAAEIISFINKKQPLIKNQKLSSGRFKEDTMPLFGLKGEKFDLTSEQKKNILTNALPDILWLKENLQIDYLNSQVFMNEMKNKNTMNFSYTKEDCRFLRKALKKTQPIIRRKIIAFFEDHLTPTRFSHIQQKVFVKKLKRVEKKISIKEKRRKRSKLHSLFTLIKDYLIIARSGLFDKKAYLKHYSDVKASNPIIHYIRHGASELRNPSNEFNTEYYLRTNKDVYYSRLNPLVHYIRFGKREGRMIEGGENLYYCYQEPIYTEQITKNILAFQSKPLISIIMPVYNIDPKWLEKAIKSVENQWYQNWELCIADDCSTNQQTKDFLSKIENKKIKITFLKKNLHIPGATNEAMKLAEGDYFLFMDNDDELTVDTLYENVKIINELQGNVDLLYADEDKIDTEGYYCEPYYKPDYSPDRLLSQNYMVHPTVIKHALIEKIGGLEIGLEGAQDYDLVLKATENTEKIHHIRKILYHWRKIPGSIALDINSKEYAYKSGKKALENALERRNLSAKVLFTKHPGIYRINYNINENPLISIIIHFQYPHQTLIKCINSIIKKTSYQNYEIILINNNGIKNRTNKTLIKRLKKDSRMLYHENDTPLNDSQVKNFAVNQLAHGKQIILLNNDTKIITEDWIESLLQFSQRQNTGAVGSILFPPYKKKEYTKAFLKSQSIKSRNVTSSFNEDNWPHAIQNVQMLSKACLMVKKTIYLQIGGFDEREVVENDVDFCLRLIEKGYLNVYTPFAKVYHTNISI